MAFILIVPINVLFRFCVFLFTSCAVNKSVAERQVSETTALQLTQNTNGQNATAQERDTKLNINFITCCRRTDHLRRETWRQDGLVRRDLQSEASQGGQCPKEME